MLKWLNKQGVESDKGFILQGMHRFYYHYTEGDHVMIVYVEPLKRADNSYYERVSKKSIGAWQPPYEQEVISKTKADQILKNIDEALSFMQIEHVFSEN